MALDRLASAPSPERPTLDARMLAGRLSIVAPKSQHRSANIFDSPIYLARPGFWCNLRSLTEQSLPGVGLPLVGAFPLLLFPALPSRSRNGGSNQTKKQYEKEPNKSMTTSRGRTSSPSSRDRGAVKSTQAAAASLASRKPTRQEATPPSNADIATKAHEIWRSRGQEPGNDQQHWFEAEQQLQQV